MAMSTECTNAPGIRRKAASTPEASVTATLMRMPSSPALATAATTAALAASAVMARCSTLCCAIAVRSLGHYAQEGVVELAVVVENATAHVLPAPGDGVHVGVVVVAASKGFQAVAAGVEEVNRRA